VRGMKIFDQYLLLLRPALTTARACRYPPTAVVNTAMDQLMRLPWQYWLLTSKNLTKGAGF
jgi:hypothetical protein